MAVHHAVGISRQRNSGYRPSSVNIVAQGLFTPDPSLSPTHLSIRRGRATTTHYTHHQVSLVVSLNTTLVPSLGLHIGPACEAGLSAGMWRERVSPQIRKKEKKKKEQMELLMSYKWDDVQCIVKTENIKCYSLQLTENDNVTFYRMYGATLSKCYAAYTGNTMWTLECAIGLLVGGALQVTVVTVTVVNCAYSGNTMWTLECAIGLLVGGALQVTVVTVTVVHCVPKKSSTPNSWR